ncbi:MAG: hypothetical protein ACPG77_06880 [Nannocystaceae bacterium]
MSFPFIIREITGLRRTIVLKARSLPYRPVTWSIEQAMEVTWYPGNPVASVQVLGPRHLPLPITGMWKDNFLLDPESSAELYNFPSLLPAAISGEFSRGGNSFMSSGTVPSQKAVRARALRDAFYLICKSGSKLQLEWGSLVRYGHLKELTFEIDREEDLLYEMSFAVTGDAPSEPKRSLLPKLQASSLLDKLLALLDGILDTLLKALFAATAFKRRVIGKITRISSAISGILSALGDLAGFVFAPLEVLGAIRAGLISIKLAGLDLLDTLRIGPSAALEASIAGNSFDMATASLTESELRSRTVELISEAVEAERQLEETAAPNIIGTYVSPGGSTSLRDISTRFFDTPSNWPKIAAFNGLSGSIVPRGTVVQVPRLT